MLHVLVLKMIENNYECGDECESEIYFQVGREAHIFIFVLTFILRTTMKVMMKMNVKFTSRWGGKLRRFGRWREILDNVG